MYIKEQYESLVKEYTELYKDIKDANIDNEVTAELTGRLLFEDKNFIKRLSENQTIFDKIKNLISDLIVQFKGTKEEKELRKLEKTFLEMSKEIKSSSNENKVDFSIQEDDIGDYVKVDVDQMLFDGLSRKEQTQMAREIIRERFTDINNQPYMTSKTSIKYTNPKENNKLRDIKNKLSTELDNLLSVSKRVDIPLEKDNRKGHKNHEFAKDGWEYYYSRFEVNGEKYIGKLNIGIKNNIKTLYDVNNIKDIKSYKKAIENRQLDKQDSICVLSLIGNNISQKDVNVNSNDIAPTKEDNKSSFSNETNYSLSKEIDDALDNKSSNNMIELNTINEDTAKIIKDLTGIDVTSRKQVLYDNDIRHMFNNHSNESTENQRNQIPITKQDILEIPNILENYDDIVKGTNNREGQTIRYIKNYNDSYDVVVEVIPKKSSLKIKTMWKVSTLNNSNIAPVLTTESEVNNSTLNKSIITPIGRNIKSNQQYSLVEDNQGRVLTSEQQEYFKDSKVRTPDGSLRVMYRGGNETFNVFDRSKARASGMEGNGFYFTTSKEHAMEYENVSTYTYRLSINAGKYIYLNRIDSSSFIRPAISLASGTKILFNGDGTPNNPYIVLS